MLNVPRLVNIFRRQVTGGLDIALRRFAHGKLGALELCRFDAVRGIDVALQGYHAGRCQSVFPHIFIGRRQILGVETNDVRALMPAKIVRHARLRIVAILAGQYF